MEPYLEYLRQMVKTRPDEISALANEVSAEVFLEHGTPEDVEMLRELAKKRPFLAPSLERAFDLQRWKQSGPSKPTETVTQPAALPMAKQPSPKITSASGPVQTLPGEEPALSALWAGLVVLIVAVIGLLWLALKKTAKNDR